MARDDDEERDEVEEEEEEEEEQDLTNVRGFHSRLPPASTGFHCQTPLGSWGHPMRILLLVRSFVHSR